MNFLDDNILLTSPLAIELFNDYAKNLSVIDYHCHINQSLILQNKSFANITELWLYGDHYKWRLMRNCGVDEKYITGNATDFEKFEAFAKCLPFCIGNPIFIWCNLELKKYFGYSGEINGDTAKYIFDMTKEKLSMPDFSVRNIIKKSNVELICTTDDPIDDLTAHKLLAQDLNFNTKVLPTFRPDKAVHIENAGFCDYLKSLEKVCNKTINSINDLCNVLELRLNYFIKANCVITDHALNNFIFENCSDAEADEILCKALKGENITDTESEKFQTYVMLFLSKLYVKNNMVMQLHFNCLRNNNSLMFKKLGPDTGFDCINSSANAYKLVNFLNALAIENNLPKTIIYSLDPADDKLINTVINCFQGSGIKGKLQHGSAWWFNDTKYGMKEHFKTLSEYSVLGNFIGMLTDSRSFTSYIRHDYFRRLLCNYIAKQVENGEYPHNIKNLKMLVENVCYNNIKNYLSV